MFGCIVPKPIDIKILEPPKRRICHCVNHFRLEIIECRHKIIKPCCKSIIVPALRVFTSIGKVKRCKPIGFLLHEGMLLMDVMGHIIQKDIDMMLVSDINHLFEFRFGAETGVGGAERHRPIAMIAAELGFWRLRPLTIRTFGIFHHRGNPQCIDAQIIKISFLYFLGNTHHIAAIKIHFGIHIRPVQRSIIVLVSIHKTINHRIVHDHAMRVLSIHEFHRIKHHPAPNQRNQDFVAHPFRRPNPNPNKSIGKIRRHPSSKRLFWHNDFQNIQIQLIVVLTQSHLQLLILPHRQNTIVIAFCDAC